MKLRNNKIKYIYFAACFLVVLFLSGCNDLENKHQLEADNVDN